MLKYEPRWISTFSFIIVDFSRLLEKWDGFPLTGSHILIGLVNPNKKLSKQKCEFAFLFYSVRYKFTLNLCSRRLIINWNDEVLLRLFISARLGQVKFSLAQFN